MSRPAATAFDKVDEHTTVKVFSTLTEVLQNADDDSGELSEINISSFKNVLLPFAIYTLACGGFIFLIFENIRLWKVMHSLKPTDKLIWTSWVIILGLMSLLPVYLGTSLIAEGLWYMFIIAAILSLFVWVQWASRN